MIEVRCDDKPYYKSTQFYFHNCSVSVTKTKFFFFDDFGNFIDTVWIETNFI